ncbi:hypothetical protein QE364_001100 [Nocardioides zeae]|uniref:Uncharacterized protein n=1 Tax=Nocardioides zeae TaxID=1457234 RepID=A0ACC6IFK9_9ACTN|nr:hypothetical protein [Nocardioides zeae]MDR6176387.1 hypothetical protein [Nocardioides zeae]MDR6209400.1 hypothetical protein [Nocardioides zeae]
MTTRRGRRSPGERLPALLLVVALLLVAGAWTLTAGAAGDDRLQQAPVVLVGPDVVTAAVASEVEAMPGSELAVGGTDDLDRARARLADGEVVAVLVIDLAGTQDRLLLSDDHAPARDRALVAQARSIADARDRTVVVERGDRLSAAVPAATTTSLLAVAAGFALVVVVSMVWGPVPRTFRRGVVRVAGIGALGVAAGLLATALASHRAGAVVLAAVVASGLVTLACEALAGLRGLLVAAALLLVLPLPLVLAGDPWLLAQPWRTVTAWTIVGAATDALSPAVATTTVAWRSGVVLAGSAVLALLVLLSTRLVLRRRAREASPDDDPSLAPAPWRRQMAVLAVTLMASTTAVLTVGLPGNPPPVAPRVSLASTTECFGPGKVDDIDDLNRIADLRATDAFQGGDVGASATLQDGRTVWMFGDTLRGPDAGGARFVRNSMLVVAPDCLQVVVARSGGAIIPDRDGGVGYWPMSVAVLAQPGYDLVEVTAQRVRTTDPDDPFGFENVGPAVATFVVPVGGVPQLVGTTDVGPDDADTTRPMWGAATTLADGWLYLYGTARPADPAPGTGFSLQVARTRPADVNDPSTWTYWDGATWGRDPADAAALIGATEGTSQTLSVFERDGTWYAVSKRGEVLGSDLVVWTAPAPTGPFTAGPPVAELPSDPDGGLLRYMPLAHPDLLPEDGDVVVSYSRNSTDLGAVLEDPLLYRPRFIRVPLPGPSAS